MPWLVRVFTYTLVLLFLATFLPASYSQTPPSPPVNSDATYQQLRNLQLSGEAVSVSNLTLHRDAGTFHLRTGNVCFLAPVQGKVTGAVFVGVGIFVLDPPIGAERHSLRLLTKSSEFSEAFSQMVLRFTDQTFDEIKKAGRLKWL